MLILSRRVQEGISFPNLGVRIALLQVQGHKVRLGIEAPRELNIVRTELMEESSPSPEPSPHWIDQLSPEDRHSVRNRLNTIRLALELVTLQLAAGQEADVTETLDTAVKALSELDQSIGELADRTHQRGQGKVLIVDDDTNERELLANILRLNGFDVITAGDGAKAMETLEQASEAPRAILMDMRMPTMSGADAIRAIRGNPAYQDTRIFVCSGSQRTDTGTRSEDSPGIDAWFSKPLNPASLVQALDSPFTSKN